MFGRRKRREFLEGSLEARRAVEDERPWFLEADDEAPELRIEAGRSAALDERSRHRRTPRSER